MHNLWKLDWFGPLGEKDLENLSRAVYRSLFALRRARGRKTSSEQSVQTVGFDQFTFQNVSTREEEAGTFSTNGTLAQCQRIVTGSE